MKNFCLRCQALLPANTSKCPKCNLNYDPDNPQTYLTQNDLFKTKYWLPGLCLAIVIGFVTYAIVFSIYSTKGMGIALFFAVPTSFGAILGYMTRSIKIWWTIGLTVTAVACLALGITVSGITGIFCGLTLGAIFLGPALVGVTLGGLLSKIMLKKFSQKFSFAPIIVLTLLPIGNGYFEDQIFTQSPPNIVQTSFVIHGSQKNVWHAIRFYEDIKGNPPFLLKMGLPRPLGTEGNHWAVGSLTKCFYNKGHYIVKQIKQLEEGKLLEFNVIKQDIHFEHDVTLLDGSFKLKNIGPQTTEVILTTRYQSRLRPTWLWKPIEEKSIKTLHEYVLENMRKTTPSN